VLIGGVAAVGGFNDVPVEKLPRIELGESYSTNAIDVTVQSVTLSGTSAFHHFTDEGFEYVTVELEATATTDEPSIFARQLIAVLLEGVISPDADDVLVDVTELRNGGSDATLQPGLPMRIAYSWKVPTGAAQVGDDIVIGIFEEHGVPDSPVFDDLTEAVPVVRIVTTLEAGS
jgi:hypothetical protein